MGGAIDHGYAIGQEQDQRAQQDIVIVLPEPFIHS
jgi:hypothetical protein